jgi:hypothetical protein
LRSNSCPTTKLRTARGPIDSVDDDPVVSGGAAAAIEYMLHAAATKHAAARRLPTR